MITADAPVFALGGTINALPIDLDRAPLPPPIWPLTAGNHFRFGFDAEAFASRRSGGARYWTSYGAPSRRHEGFVRELARALTAIAAVAGPIAIGGTGGIVALAAAALARRLGIDAVIARVEIIEHPVPSPATGLPVLPIPVAFEDFAVFARGFARHVGCGDAWLALAAYATEHCERPVVADHGELRLVNNGIDERLGACVAPPLVTLVDNETFTGLDRWLIARRRRGVAQLLRWSPELVAAQLDSPAYRDWLASTHAAGGAGRAAWTNRAARRALWQQSFPDLAFAADAGAACGDPRLVARMRDLSRRLRRLAPGCGTQHHMPLHRLAERLQVELDPRYAEASRAFGVVTPSPARRPLAERVA